MSLLERLHMICITTMARSCSFRNAFFSKDKFIKLSRSRFPSPHTLCRRFAAVPARSRVEEAHTTIRSYLDTMDTVCSFESKASELHRLSEQLEAGKLQESESNLLSKRLSTLQQQVCPVSHPLFSGNFPLKYMLCFYLQSVME